MQHGLLQAGTLTRMLRRATWILWLMLALLPVRGWATASMAMSIDAVGSAAVAQADLAANPAENAMPACHQADDGDSRTVSCQACDWCHAALGLPADTSVQVRAAPAVSPLPDVARNTGRPAVGGLERPPRLFLA
jgi:cytochrome c553